MPKSPEKQERKSKPAPMGNPVRHRMVRKPNPSPSSQMGPMAPKKG